MSWSPLSAICKTQLSRYAPNNLPRMNIYSVCYDAFSFTPPTTNFTTPHCIFLACIIRRQMHFSCTIITDFCPLYHRYHPMGYYWPSWFVKLGLDLSGGDRTIQELIDRGLSARSRSTYRTGINHYLRFYRQFGLPSLPLSQLHLCRFTAFFYAQNLSPSATRVNLSGVRYYQIQAGGPDPSHTDMPQLHYVLRATPPTNHTCHPTPPPLRMGRPADHLHCYGQHVAWDVLPVCAQANSPALRRGHTSNQCYRPLTW